MAKHNITLASRMGKTYLPPCAEIIQIESQTVLCASGGVAGMKGTTEGVGISDFGW